MDTSSSLIMVTGTPSGEDFSWIIVGSRTRSFLHHVGHHGELRRASGEAHGTLRPRFWMRRAQKFERYVNDIQKVEATISKQSNLWKERRRPRRRDETRTREGTRSGGQRRIRFRS